jgi:hypothetical protein
MPPHGTRSRHAMRHRHVDSMGEQMNATNYRTLTRGWLAGLTAVASCLFLSQLAGQTPSPQAPATDTNQQPGPTIKAESRLVLVDAVVTDKKGNYVHDLTRNDFNVYEDDKKQSVASFSFGADTTIQPQEQKRYLILFFDNSTMSTLDQIQAKVAAIKFIDANAGPDRLMAVVEFGGSLRTVQSFTADGDLLRAAATGMETSWVNPNDKVPQEAEDGARVMLLSVRTLAKNLSGFPGRKMVVLFSSGFVLSSTTRVDLRDAISDCNKANVAVYVLDARALLASPPGASSLRSTSLPLHHFCFFPPCPSLLSIRCVSSHRNCLPFSHAASEKLKSVPRVVQTGPPAPPVRAKASGPKK